MVIERRVAGSVALEITIAASPERVWRAITTPEEQIHFVPGAQRVEFEARLGGSVEFSGNEGIAGGYTMRGKIIEFEPPHSLAFTLQWKDSDLPETIIRFTLESVESGTRISFLQTGFGSDHEQVRAMHQYQFASGLSALKALLEAPAAASS